MEHTQKKTIRTEADHTITLNGSELMDLLGVAKHVDDISLVNHSCTDHDRGPCIELSREDKLEVTFKDKDVRYEETPPSARG